MSCFPLAGTANTHRYTMQVDFTNKDAVIAYAKTLVKPGVTITVFKNSDRYTIGSGSESPVVWESGKTMWWVSLVNKTTGERVIVDPVFLVKAETHEEAIAKVLARLDLEEWPTDTYELSPQIVEFGEMGPDVAYYK